MNKVIKMTGGKKQMKKAKKLLSVFLAALMVMTTLGGVMTASAMSNAEAATAAEAFNATRPDHSAVYENMSAKAAKQTKDTLNSLLSAILKASDVKSTLYSDQTISSLMILLNGKVSFLSDLKPHFCRQGSGCRLHRSRSIHQNIVQLGRRERRRYQVGHHPRQCR